MQIKSRGRRFSQSPIATHAVPLPRAHLFDIFNVAISTTALILSIGSAIYGARQYRASESLRTRDELIEALGAMTRFDIMYNAVRRERAKTGMPTTDFEKEAFEGFDLLQESHKAIRPSIELLLSQNKITPTFKELGSFRIYRETAIAQTDWLRLLHERFVRYNENKIGELRLKLIEIREKLIALGADLSEIP